MHSRSTHIAMLYPIYRKRIYLADRQKNNDKIRYKSNGAISIVDATMQKDWPNGRQVHPHNGPVFSLPPFSGGRLTTQEPGLNKTFASRDVAKSSPASPPGWGRKGARPDSTSNGRKGYLSSLLTVTRAKSISRMAGFLRCRNLLTRRTDSLRLFGTWNVSPCLSSTVQIGLALGQTDLRGKENE